MSRWLVGSSSTSTGASDTRVRARCTRLAWPPESSSNGRSISAPRPRRSATASTSQGLSPIPWCSASRSVVPDSSPDCSSTETSTPDPRRTEPDSGSLVPASIASSVDLPVPLMPTTAIRSPSETVRSRSSNNTLPGRLAERPWASTRIIPSELVRPGSPRLRSVGPARCSGVAALRPRRR